jgi:hypothetical protein
MIKDSIYHVEKQHRPGEDILKTENLVLWFGSEMSPIGQCVEGLVPNWWHYWEVVKTLGGGKK